MRRPSRAAAAAVAVAPAQQAPPAGRRGAADGQAIFAEGLVKSFGGVCALDDVSLTVPYGTVLGLLGPNGSGKTTTVRILTTLLAPDAGRVVIGGIDARKSAGGVRALIGMAGQYAAVDPVLTGRENLVMMGRLAMLPRAAARQRAQELLGRFGLREVADSACRTYSGGLRRRLDLAAALVHRPALLFFDEPTTGLDPRSRRELWAVIKQLAADGATVLLTTQYLEEADQLADQIVMLDRGKIIAQGSPAQLKAQLGASVIEICFHSETAADRAIPLLPAVYPLAQRGSRLEITVGEDVDSALGILHTLHAHDVSLSGFAMRDHTLDDVFLKLTGQATDEATKSQEAAGQ
jgi:daunorubicin resistance ABC transporter ATP-binding subunit